MSIVKIAKNKAWQFDFRLIARRSDTGKEMPYTGATVSAWLSATSGGNPINALHVVSLTERTHRTGSYFGVLDAASVASDCGVLTTVYEVCEQAGDRDSRKLTVVASSEI
jgi:hypothetical protein